jgi:hypothetical protein
MCLSPHRSVQVTAGKDAAVDYQQGVCPVRRLAHDDTPLIIQFYIAVSCQNEGRINTVLSLFITVTVIPSVVLSTSTHGAKFHHTFPTQFTGIP